MPIDLPDLQRRSVPLGEIRIGYSVPIPGKSGRQPMRSDTFIFTTDQFTAAVVAARYGGTAAPWDRRRGRFAVTTTRDLLHVWVPPRGLAVDANMELWDGGKCLRRCTGTRMLFPSAGECLCPQPDDPSDPDSVQRARDERHRLASLQHPRACKPKTLISVSITDLPGLTGVWRIASGSEAVAVETADQGDTLAIARDAGAYLPADLIIDHRFRLATGTPYPVLKLRLVQSAEDLARGELPPGPAGLLRQLRAGTRELAAITRGPQPPGEPPPAGPAHYETADTGAAQACASRAAEAATRAEVEALQKQAAAGGTDMEDLILPPDSEVYQTLREYLQARWRELRDAGRAAAPARQPAPGDDSWPDEEALCRVT